MQDLGRGSISKQVLLGCENAEINSTGDLEPCGKSAHVGELSSLRVAGTNVTDLHMPGLSYHGMRRKSL